MSSRVARLHSAMALALGLAVVAPAAFAPASADAAGTTFYLDSYNPVDASSMSLCTGPGMLLSTTPPGCGNSITAPIVFEDGTVYTVKVTGAVSAWGAWPSSRCGRPKLAPEFPSPGRPSTPVGDDAQFRFAIPTIHHKCPKTPKKTSLFQVNLGSGWLHPIANGDPVKPSKDDRKTGEQHPYTFSFTGEGGAPQFRFVDYYPSDNGGMFQITVEQ